ncbi:mitochondrial ribosomal protein L37-domain-containing protein [Phaeosphaeriaceae sp. PMI808]|nr:mitochondrial ribosomal protein L37-domain-containing protein [Phaeosphaeriaceae sp. PMI808]
MSCRTFGVGPHNAYRQLIPQTTIMICHNCLRAASRARICIPTIKTSQAQRYLGTSSRLSNATQTPATSTSTVQSISTPLTPAPSPDLEKQTAEASKKKVASLVRSSIAAGTPLKGLNFEKSKSDPIALADDEYPPWLWTLLSRQEKTAEGAGQGDLFSKSKKQRRLAAKRLRREQAMNPESLVPKVPVYKQTIDLPAGDGSVQSAVEAAEARDGLTKAMRSNRRATIKEANFLKAMR